MIPDHIRLIFRLYILALAAFTIFRGLFFFAGMSHVQSETTFGNIITAFLIGLRFDIVISGYLLILPFLIISAASFFKKQRIAAAIVFWLVFILFTIAFLVCAIDIPFFRQFFMRMNVTAFLWVDNPSFVFRMIVEEPKYWLIAVPAVLIVWLFYRILRKIFKKFQSRASRVNPLLNIVVSIFCLLLMLIGIRGRVEIKSPIRVGTAYFCNDSFINQMGLNPNFTLLISWFELQNDRNKGIMLMNDELALSNVQKYLGIQSVNAEFPIGRMRNINDSDSAQKLNVVIVMMESMSAEKMGRHGNPNHLTPFLDSLCGQGYYFENAYTAGIHTYNGIYGTLFSYPSLYRQHPMKNCSMPKYHGIYSTLRKNGYSTLFFTTHDAQFDNMEGFMKANDCERVVSDADYPSEEIKTTLGVPDDFMFRYSVPILNDYAAKGKPFIATLMTSSDHGPYYVPDYFQPKSDDGRNAVIEYADYSLSVFLKEARKQSWFKNTLFVFIADHGAIGYCVYDMQLSYHHTPLLFYCPAVIKKPETYSCMAGQIDVFPTIMGILKIPYLNNTFGIDLLSESRPCIYFCADDKYGAVNQNWFLIGRKDGRTSLYKYRSLDMNDYAQNYPDTLKELDLFARSNMQACQYILSCRKQ